MGFPRKPSGILRRVGDQGIKLAQGVIGVPETAVGLADLVTGGHAGKAAEDAGIRFKDAKGVLGEYLSPEQQAADTAVQDAKGFFPTIGAMVKNPSTIIGGAMESAPTMLSGGVAARGIMAGLPYVAPKMAAKMAAAEAAPLVASQGARTLAETVPIAAGAAGEGIVTAGLNAEQVRQQTPDGLLTPEQIGLSAGSGALTGLIGFGAGKVANQLGIGDVQTMLARGKLGAVGADAEQAAAQKGLLRKIGEGFANEGILQELPQSYQEQVAQNLALGKPWDQGAAEAGAQGMMAGGLLGMGGNAVSHFAGPGPDQTGQQSQTPPSAPPTTPPNAPPSVPQTNSPGSPAGTAGTAGTPQANMGPISQAAAVAAGAGSASGQTTIPPTIPQNGVGGIPQNGGVDPNSTTQAPQQSGDDSYAKNRSIMDGILSDWNKTQQEHPASTVTPQAPDQQQAAPDGAPSPANPNNPNSSTATTSSGKLSDAATIAVNNGAHEVEKAKIAQQQAEEVKKKGESAAKGLPQFTAKSQPTTLGPSAEPVKAGPGFGLGDVIKPVNAATSATPTAPTDPAADNKAKWIKAVVDKNRLNGDTGVQLTVTDNGKLSFLGNPGATKDGRALLATLDEALKAGVTTAEIAQALRPASTSKAVQDYIDGKRPDAPSIAEVQAEQSAQPGTTGQGAGDTQPTQDGAAPDAAAWQGMTPEQRRRSVLEQTIATGTENNGGVMVKLRPSAIEDRKQQLAAMGDAGKMTDAQPTATPNVEKTGTNQQALDRIASGKAWFGNELKAKNWVHTNGLADTHEVQMTAPRRFEVVLKKQPQEQINANQDQQTQSQVSQDPLLSKLATGYGYPGGVDTMPAGLGTTARKLHSAITSADVAKAQEILRPENKRSREAFEHLFDGRVKLPNTVKGTNDTVADFLGKVSAAQRQAGVAVTEESSVPESGSKPENENVAFIKALNDARKELPPGFEIQPQRRSDGTPTVSLMENGKNAIDGLSRTEAGVQEALQHAKLRHTERQAQVSDKASLLQELRTKLSALGQRALDAGDGAMSVRISGFTVGMKDTDANLTRKWVDEVVAEREQAVSKLEAKAKKELDSQKPLSVPQKLRAQKDLASTQSAPTDDAATAAGFTHLAKDHQWSKTVVVGENRRELFNIREFGPVGDRSYRVSKSTTFPGTVVTGAPSVDIGTFKSLDDAVNATGQKPTTSQPVTTAAPVSVPQKLRAKAAQAEQARADYFTPGNIVSGYGQGHDRVISYTPPNEKGEGWSVTVQSVVKENGQWVNDPMAPRQRTHATMPDSRELAKGPVERAEVEDKPAEIQNAPADQSKPLSVPEKLQAKREANDIREQSLENAQNNADTEIKKEAENDPAKQGSTPTLNHPLDEGQQPTGSQSPARGAKPDRAGEGRRDDGGVHGSGGQADGQDIDSRPRLRGKSASDQHGTDGKLAGNNQRHAPDFIPAIGGLTREGSWFDTAKRNIDLIELAIKIESENRAATPEEQAQLSKYVGFGAGAIRNELFPVPPEYAKRQEPNRLIWPNFVRNARFKPLAERIEALPREWQQSILQSSQYAHYTSEGIIRSVWSGLQRLGFTGGNVFEPGMGIGSFAMLMPNTVRQTSRYTGVEFDAPTALIARLLSPQQNMLHGDFIKRKFPQNFFDVNVGNPPFSQTKIFGDPQYEKHGFMLHDFFFAKGIDLVRPGGIQVFVTSKGTMDKQNDKARKYLSDRADLLGAVRLPSTAFEDNAGTSVVTDVIFLRKRAPGEEPSGHAWGSVTTVDTKDGPVVVNEYFAAHPEMVLGQQRISGNVDDMGRRISSNGFGGEKYTVVSYDSTPAELDAKFAKAIENLPENAYSVMNQSPDAIKAETEKIDFDPSVKREGVVYLAKDGALMKVENGVGKPLADTVKLSAKDEEWFKSYVGLRDLVQESRFAQVSDGNWEAALKKLNTAYDAFRKQHGPIKDYRTITRKSTDEDGNVVETQTRIYKNKNLWSEDYDSSLIIALEDITEEGNIVKAPFLLGRTIGKPVTREVKTIGDALAVSLDSTGELNLDDVANRMHISRDEAIDALGNQIYQAPNGEWQLADEYLSGNVVQKLDEAEEAARLKPELRRNVEALKQAQPEKLGPSKISAKLGSSWIPVEHVNEFSTEIDAGNVTFDPKTETWQVEGGNLRSQRKASAEYGTADRSPSELLEAVLNSRPIKITAKTADGKTVTNNEATTAANEAAKKIKDKFKGWVWTDTNRASELVEIYNRRYNNIAPRKFDGSHLTLPGVSLRYKLHPHQLRAIWRIIQTGNTYLAHAVGAGKTIEMIAAGMEQKRLGLVKKPMYVVPNHMLEQFSNEFMDLYPLANIMVADDQNFSADKRKAFIASATLNNPDAIIITHDAFQRIGVKEESIAPIRDEILTDLELELSSMAKDQGARVRRSQLEQQIEAVKQRFDRILGAGGKDATIKFEDMGVDFVFVDEAHAMRKLDFQTSQQIKGIDPNGSKRALDMYIKTRILDKKNPGRSMVFASGTPVTNTMGELYTIMRFFAAHQMDVDGISTFDAWSRQFGEVAPALEPNAAGKYEMVERFAKFDNVPELMSRVRQFMDVLTSDNLGALIKRPDLVGGKPNMNIISMSQSLKSYMQNVLAPRIEVSKKWKPTRDEPFNTDPILKIISDGRFAAIDPRFFGGALQEGETSIINEMGDKITANYHATKDNVYLDKDGKPEPVKGSTQIVFYNNGYGASAKENRGFDARAALTKRLTAGGIPRNEIAWFDDADTDAKKEAIFKDMRSGKLKVLIGSAKKMGTGVNVQKRLAVLHYQDPPWYPADVEQPHGRIIRQGNQNPEVKIEWYTTKGTYQSTMWQMVGRKQRFIDQAFTGDKNLRSMEDMGEASLFEQAAAVASGDPRAIQLAGLRQDVERFERLQAAHASEQINILSSLRSHEWSVQALNNRINTLSKAFNAIGGRFFSFADTHGKVNGVVYSKPGEFGQAIKDAFNKVAADSVMDGGKRIIDKQIARLGDAVTVTMDSSLDRHDKADGSFYLMVNVGETSLQVAHSVAMGADVDAAGLARRVFNQINSIDSDLRKARMELTDAETEITKLRKKSGAPFEYQQEMVEKYAELKRLEEELRSEGEAIQNQQTNVAINADGEIITGKQASEGDGKPAVYSHGAGPGISHGELAHVVEDFLSQFTHQAPVRILDSAVGVLPGVNNGDGISGAVHRGRIHLFLEHIPGRIEAVKTLWHEMLHYGLRRFLTRDQYIAEMLDLYKKDMWVRGNANKWLATEEGKDAAAYGGADYARARGVDEALAQLSEDTQGGKESNAFKANAFRRVVSWLARLADKWLKKYPSVAAYLRGMTNEEAKAYVRGVFSRLENDDKAVVDDWAFTADPAFKNTKITGQTTRQYTPEQLATFGHVGRQVTVPTLKERAQAMTKDLGKKLAQGIADQFAPVKEISKDAYALLRLSKGASGALETFLNGGKLKLTNGVYDFDETQKGGVIDKLLKPLQGEHHDFLWWVAANRAESLMADDRENLFTPDDIKALKTLTDGNTAFDYTIQNGIRKGQVTRNRSEIYKDAQATLQAFNKNALDMAEQSGLIDPESRKVWESEFYVPFYRVADTTEGGIMGMNVKSGVVRQQAFKHLKGGKQALNSDLLDNVLMNWAHLLDASAKNRAAKATIEAAEGMGLAAGGDQATLKQIASSIGNRNGVVWFMDEGVKRYSLIDDPYLMTALTSLEYAGMRSPVMNAMSAFKRVLTIGVTASPFFKIRNLIRDSVQVIGTGNISYNPAKNIAEGWKLTNPKNDEYFRLLASGGTIHFGTMLEGSEAKRVQALVESGVDAGTILNDEHKVKAFYRKYIEPGITAYNELGNRGESVNRAALYNQLVKQGVSHADAALQARDLMDFSMQGSFTTIRFLTQVVPFMNARMQGLYKLGRAAKEDPVRFSAVLGATALLSLGLLAAYSDDDDWKRRTDADRNNYWWFKFGGTAFRIPKPFEIGALATLAERSFELAFEKEMTSERFRNQVMALLGYNLSMNPIPQIVKPILDVYANVDSFTGIPIESMGMERLKSEYRFNDKTSMAARGLSTAANSVMGVVGKDALSPVKMDHLLQGYFGWLGTFVVQVGDILARPATGQPTQATRDYMKTLTGGIASDLRDAPSRYVGQVYEQAKAIEQAYSTWRMLLKEGKVQEAQEFREDNLSKIANYHRIEHVKKAETSLNNRIRMVERSTSMDADQKRELIRGLNQNKERIAKMAA